MKADTHLHTTFSCDGNDSIEAMCQTALEKNLTHVCFTEHCDFNPDDEGFNFYNYQAFSDAIHKARDTFAGKLTILKGVEFGEPHCYPDELQNISTRDYDMIIGSVHWFGKHFTLDPHLNGTYSVQEIFDHYYSEVLKAAEHGGFDVLAHFDFPKRMWKGSSTHGENIDRILETIIKKDIALEINSSPMRRGMTECAPHIDILRRYIELNGRKCTVGSDAHRISDLAADIDYAYAMIRKEGGIPGFFVQRIFTEIPQ